jgi:hypothetical protein
MCALVVLRLGALDQHVDVVDLQAIEFLVRSLHVQQQSAKARKVLPMRMLASMSTHQIRAYLHRLRTSVRILKAIVLAIAHIIIHVRERGRPLLADIPPHCLGALLCRAVQRQCRREDKL